MKVLILNDTSNYHHGCFKVMEYLIKEVASKHQILASVRGNIDIAQWPVDAFDEAELILINGEGTMHHDRPLAIQYLELLREAKRRGKKTALINTVWQSMTLDKELIEVLKDTYISVREVLSQQELQKSGIDADIHLDLSYFVDVPEIPQLQYPREYVVGKFFSQSDYRPKGINSVDIFKQDWNTIVNILRGTDWFITGRHHEMYAACKARCPFATLAGNTWKNQGLFLTAGVDIKVADSQIRHSEIPKFVDFCKERNGEYLKLFNWMERQPLWTVDKIA